MQSLTEEIQSFPRKQLRKQCTRVTSLSGRRIIESWKGSTVTVVEDPAPPEKTLGYVPDTTWDLQVGVITPYLLLGELTTKANITSIQNALKPGGGANVLTRLVLKLNRDARSGAGVRSCIRYFCYGALLRRLGKSDMWLKWNRLMNKNRVKTLNLLEVNAATFYININKCKMLK